MIMTLETPARLPTGIQGLDDILGGGLIPNQLYVVEGAPGAGKTTLALQFLLAGQAQDEPGLYVTLSETAEELHAVAASHGFDLKGDRIALFELASADAALSPEREITLLHPRELKLGETVKLITDEAVKTKQRSFSHRLSRLAGISATNVVLLLAAMRQRPDHATAPYSVEKPIP
jgi:KaiC/GvpD/RAD55 family RecA-like ATPase